MGFAGSATALLVACVIPSYAAASTTFTFVVLVYQNVCGFYLELSVIPAALRWISYTRYAHLHPASCILLSYILHPTFYVPAPYTLLSSRI